MRDRSILLNYLPFLIDCKSFLTTRKRDAAIVAARFLPGYLRPTQSFLNGYAVVDVHTPKIEGSWARV